MFIQITNDGTYLGSSARSTEGYFPVSHELSKSLRARVIKSTANVRRAIGTQPAPVVVGVEELWEDIKEDPYSLVETYADIYSKRRKIDLTVVVYVKTLKEELERNVNKIVSYFVASDKIPSNLFDIVVSLAGGVEIVEALYEEPKVESPEPEIEVIVSQPVSTPEDAKEDEPTATEPTPDLDQIQTTGDENASDGKRSKSKRSKGRGRSGTQPGSQTDTSGDGQSKPES